jgi:hypothetical protein
MAIPQTDFVNGSFLSYPIGNYVKLFSVLGTRTKRTFFEAIQKLDGKDGEGMSPDQMIGLFQVGLIPYKPGITFDETSELVQEYINSNGDSGLHVKLVDAFCDSGLSDRKTVDKQRKMIEELAKIEEARNEAFIKQSWVELDKLNANLQKISDELNKSVTGEETANPSDEGGETEEEDDPLEGPATTC